MQGDRARLSPARRRADRARLPEEVVDVLVVGGGGTGAAAALDAAVRGLSVALLEAGDWAGGASGRPVALVGAGATRSLRTAAPHLARPVPVLRPLAGGTAPSAVLATGEALAGLLLAGRAGAVPRYLPRRAVAAALPGVRPGALRGGAIGTREAAVDEARHTLALVRTAAGYGARVLSRVRVTGLLPGADADPAPVIGVHAEDRSGGSVFAVRARALVVATGPAGLPGRPGTGAGATTAAVQAVLRGSAVAGRCAVVLDTPSARLSLVPAEGCWVAGADGLPAGAGAGALLDLAGRVLRRPVDPGAVLGVHAALLPGPLVRTVEPGLVVVRGVPLAAGRRAAAAAVDAATVGLPGVPPSRTAHLPLVGARADGGPEHLLPGLPPGAPGRLRTRYGDRAGEVLDLVRDDPALGRPLPGAPGILAAEVVHAVTAEGALGLDDVLTRRVRVAITTPDGGAACAAAAAALVAGPLGWDDARVQREVAAARVRAPSPAGHGR